MPGIKQVFVHCAFCRTRFASHLRVPDNHAFDRLTEVGGLAECPACHRFVSLDKHTLSYSDPAAESD